MNITPPAEGRLDGEQLEVLVRHLAATSIDGIDTRCLFHYAPESAGYGDYPDGALVEARLRDVFDAYDDERFFGPPTNLWPEDRSWYVWTDSDLWGTKVSGRRGLIGTLLRENELEAIRLPEP